MTQFNTYASNDQELEGFISQQKELEKYLGFSLDASYDADGKIRIHCVPSTQKRPLKAWEEEDDTLLRALMDRRGSYYTDVHTKRGGQKWRWDRSEPVIIDRSSVKMLSFSSIEQQTYLPLNFSQIPNEPTSDDVALDLWLDSIHQTRPFFETKILGQAPEYFQMFDELAEKVIVRLKFVRKRPVVKQEPWKKSLELRLEGFRRPGSRKKIISFAYEPRTYSLKSGIKVREARSGTNRSEELIVTIFDVPVLNMKKHHEELSVFVDALKKYCTHPHDLYNLLRY
jgi:hypothetical protein